MMLRSSDIARVARMPRRRHPRWLFEDLVIFALAVGAGIAVAWWVLS